MPVQEVSRNTREVLAQFVLGLSVLVYPDAWDKRQSRGDSIFVLDVVLSKEMDKKDLLFLDTFLEEPPAGQRVGQEA